MASEEAREASRNQDSTSLTSHAKGSGLYPEGSGEPWKVVSQSDWINYALERQLQLWDREAKGGCHNNPGES